jgi:ATP-dependent DNA helicase RecQ
MKNLIIEKLQAKAEEYGLITLKGVPTNVLNDVIVALDFDHLTEEFITQSGIDLNKIDSSFMQIFSKITSSESNRPKIILYEAFLCLINNFNIDQLQKKILVLENNFADEYINPSFLIEEDTERQISSGNEIPEDSVFYKYYSHAKEYEGSLFIQYIDAIREDFNKITIEKLLDVSNDKQLLKFEIKPESIEDTMVFLPSSSEYNTLKQALIRGEKVNIKNILVDEVTKQVEEAKYELYKLVSLVKSENLDITFWSIDDRVNKEYRDELDALFKIHWPTSAGFKSIEIYEDPEINNQIIKVNQGTIVETIIKQYENGVAGLNIKDIFLTAPTGAGKSLLFQLPAIYLASKYNAVTIVISPLIALMKDQVNAMKNNRNFDRVAYINSELSLIDREAIIDGIKNGEIDILYLSPELLLSYQISMFIGDRKIGLLIIDEAHLVTTWGRDFRVDYWYLGNYIKNLRKYNKDYKFTVVALTATAVYGGPNDMAFETLNSLSMENSIMYIGKVKRDNIDFDIKPLQINSYHEKEKLEKTASRIDEYIKEKNKAIIYCPWTSQLAEIKKRVSEEYRLRVGIYYGALDKENKDENYHDFLTGKTLTMISTKAFGMGVDIDDIVRVYHHAPSGHLADYVQEVGRAARNVSLKGIAQIDFNPKDLKFTRILYGLSSIKQYQVQMVLRKISRLQHIKKKRNLLVSVEDFQHIFNFENVDVEQKTKSSLLLIEKDLLKKYSYNVMLARPKSLFTTVFARVNGDQKALFEGKYGAFSKYVPHAKTESKNQFIYTIELDKVWEKHYSDKSFPMIKKHYFDKTLFQSQGIDVSPQLRLVFNFYEDVDVTFTKLTQRFSVVEEALSNFGERFFDKKMFTNELVKLMMPKKSANRIADLIISIYSSTYESKTKEKGFTKPDCFIQQKRTPVGIQYRVFDRSFRSVRAEMRNRFDRLFGKMTTGFQISTMYLPMQDPKGHNAGIIKLAYILEAFDLASYEISGGEKPGIFIRVNDPLKLKRLADGNYTNELLEEIDRRQKTSVSVMEHFFMNPMTTDERWEFIEKYFLGTPVEELIDADSSTTISEEELEDE